MVFGRGSNHGWTSNVDHFQQRIIAQGWHRCSGVSKRVEVAGNHANGCVAESSQFCRISRLVKASEKGSVNGRVERFHAPIEDFWVLRHVRDEGDLQACFLQRSSGATR